MFIELLTSRGEEITFNSDNIVLLAPDKKGTLIVDVNGMDFIVVQPYSALKKLLSVNDYNKSYEK